MCPYRCQPASLAAAAGAASGYSGSKYWSAQECTVCRRMSYYFTSTSAYVALYSTDSEHVYYSVLTHKISRPDEPIITYLSVCANIENTKQTKQHKLSPTIL